MATSQNQKPSSGRSTGSRSTSSSGGKKRSTSSSASRAKKKGPTRQQIAARRELYAGICAVIALFCLLSLLNVKGFLLEWLEKLVSGAIGSGFVLLPFCLFFCAGLFIVKRRGKVRLRIFSSLMLPVLWGSALHIFNCTIQFPLTLDGIIELATTGAARRSGGLISGSLAILFSKALSDAGAIVVLFLLGVTCLLISTHTSLAMLFDRVKNLPPEEEDEEEEAPPPRRRKAAPPPPPEPEPAPQPARPAAPRSSLLGGLFQGGKRRPAIDIPIRTPAAAEEEEPPSPIPFPGQPMTPAQAMGTAEGQQNHPVSSIAEPVRGDHVPEPVLPSRGEDLPPISPAVLRAQQYAARRAAETASQTAPAGERLQAEPLSPAAARPVTLPWEEPSFLQRPGASAEPPAPPQESAPAEPSPAPQPAVQPASIPLSSATPEEELPAPPQDVPAAPEEEPAGQPLRPELATAAAMAATQSPRESLGQEGPEWDAPDAETAGQAKQALEEALEFVPKDTYLYPPISLLNKGNTVEEDHTQELAENSARLVDTLKSFGVEATLIDITRGPNVTRYELQLKRGTKFSRVTNLSDDIALSLGAASVRIATIPDKLAVGIEVPNKQGTVVPIRDIVDSSEFRDSKSKISFAVGKDITGHNVVGDIKKMPHMLIAGTTGSGKSVCINSLLISLIYKATPEEVRLIMVDPKMIELGVYNGIPHLLIPVVTDPRKAAGALNWAVSEMMRRYKLFSEFNVRDLEAYNNEVSKQEGGQKLPQIVIVIDELADLMFVAASDVENAIVRIAQMARAAGMHLVIATQRPSADVITGIMKANIPSRISFAVASQIESRIILDTTGAEKLLGRGDMLYNPLGAPKPLRVQGCFITTAEIESVVEFVKKTGRPDYSEEVMEHIEKQAEESSKNAKGGKNDSGGFDDDEEDEMLPRAIEVVVETGQASVSMLQRRLKLGYSRAARLVDQMAERGIVGPFEGSKPRQVLITREQWQEMVLRKQD